MQYNNSNNSTISFDDIQKIMDRMHRHNNFLRKKYYTLSEETYEDKTVSLIKGDFEKLFGIKLDRFIEVYNIILNTTPEKLI